MNETLGNLSCARVLYYFEKISEIPRGSGNEKGISDYLVSFAKKRGLEVWQDKANNVIIKKAAKELADRPTVILQGHMDMVCEKNHDSMHDFLKDGIKIIYDNDMIRADGTTLGADDGIAVAMILALLDSDDIPHPKIEALLTTDEEVGMLGAESVDAGLFDGKILLNIDSEDEGVFTSGCAGGLKSSTIIPIEFEQTGDKCFLLSVSGLKGGHSGIDILKQRANAIKIMARLLSRIMQETDAGLCSINGGAKDNAIARYCEAVISAKQEDYKNIKKIIDEMNEVFNNEYKNTDSEINISIRANARVPAIKQKTARKVIAALLIIPHGVQSMSTDVEGLPESSNNLGVVITGDKHIEIICALRSAVPSKKYYIYDMIKAVGCCCEGKTTYKGDYPAWEFKSDSAIRSKAIELYKEMFNADPVIDIIHAGLECGIFAKKIAGVDMLSFGPNLYDIHTPNEHASISSIDRTWQFFLSLLKKI